MPCLSHIGRHQVEVACIQPFAPPQRPYPKPCSRINGERRRLLPKANGVSALVQQAANISYRVCAWIPYSRRCASAPPSACHSHCSPLSRFVITSVFSRNRRPPPFGSRRNTPAPTMASSLRRQVDALRHASSGTSSGYIQRKKGKPSLLLTPDQVRFQHDAVVASFSRVC